MQHRNSCERSTTEHQRCQLSPALPPSPQPSQWQPRPSLAHPLPILTSLRQLAPSSSFQAAISAACHRRECHLLYTLAILAWYIHTEPRRYCMHHRHPPLHLTAIIPPSLILKGIFKHIMNLYPIHLPLGVRCTPKMPPFFFSCSPLHLEWLLYPLLHVENS